MRSPERRLALVTGVSRKAGIGAAIARELARDGADLFITYYRPYDQLTGLAADPGESESLLTELRQIGGHADGLELDLADSGAPARLFDHIEALGYQSQFWSTTRLIPFATGFPGSTPRTWISITP